MSKLVPYVGIAAAVAIGVAAAPVVGPLALLLVAVGALFLAYMALIRILPRVPLRAYKALLALALIAGIASIIRNPRSTPAQWTELILCIAVLWIGWALLKAGATALDSYMSKH